jgi:CheY-like chemotaxis protein
VPPLAVLIVDDHEGFRQVARALLEADGVEVVGEAADGESAIAEVQRLRPQLVLLDIQLPDIDGFEVAARRGSARRKTRPLSS